MTDRNRSGNIYRGGDFYRICERTGFKVLASTTKQEWTGRFVRRESFERRQPQDFVRGVTDRQVVPNPRPEALDSFIGPLTTTVAVTAEAGQTALTLDDTTRMFTGDKVTVMLDNNQGFNTTIFIIVDRTHLGLTLPLPWRASAGNLFTDFTAQSLANLGAGG